MTSRIHSRNQSEPKSRNSNYEQKEEIRGPKHNRNLEYDNRKDTAEIKIKDGFDKN